MPAPRPKPIQREALVAAADRVATVQIVGRLEEELRQAEANVARLQNSVEEILAAPFDAGARLHTAVQSVQAAKQAASLARSRRDETRARLQEMTQDTEAPPAFSELQERISRLAMHPQFQRRSANEDSKVLFQRLLGNVTHTRAASDDSGSDGFDSAGSDAGSNTGIGPRNDSSASHPLAEGAPNWSSEEEVELVAGEDDWAVSAATRAQHERLCAMTATPAQLSTDAPVAQGCTNQKQSICNAEQEPEPEPLAPLPKEDALDEDLADNDVFFEVSDGIDGGWQLGSPPPATLRGQNGTAQNQGSDHAILEEIEKRTRECDAAQAAAVQALQRAQEHQIQADYKRMEAKERGGLAAALIKELEAKKESVDSFFEKQAMRDKLVTANSEHQKWTQVHKEASQRVSMCIENLVDVTVKVKCFRLNRDLLRKRHSEGVASGEYSEEDERALAQRIEELQAHKERVLASGGDVGDVA